MSSPGANDASALPLSGWMEEVRSRLASRERRSIRADPALRRAGVLVPLFVREAGLWTVVTRRTDSVEHHRGQISFPGGSAEPEDATLYHTALRESQEELGIDPADVVPLGRLSPLVSVSSFYVEPFVAAIPQPYVFRPAEAEIAEVLDVRLADLLLPDALEKRPCPGREEPVLFYKYGEQVIWGMTARIVEELLTALR